MTACCTPFVIPRFVVGGAGDGNRTYLISLRLRRRRLRKADVRFRPAKVSNGLRIQPIDHLLLNGDFQYIQDLPGCVRNGKLGSDSGLLAAANIRDHCTSGVAPKADVQDFSFNFRDVLKAVVPRPDSVRQFSTLNGSTAYLDVLKAAITVILSIMSRIRYCFRLISYLIRLFPPLRYNSTIINHTVAM
jgi:hypothetical protein